MIFRIVANATFEAEDIDDAFLVLARHFALLAAQEDGVFDRDGGTLFARMKLRMEAGKIHYEGGEAPMIFRSGEVAIEPVGDLEGKERE